MNQLKAATIACAIIVPALVIAHSDAWSGCTVEQRIELGKQGYDKAEVEKTCDDSTDAFWDILSRELATGLATGLTDELNQVLGLRDNSKPAPSPGGSATVCQTNYGTCPLLGGTIGHPCYCPGRNGYTFTGTSR